MLPTTSQYFGEFEGVRGLKYLVPHFTFRADSRVVYFHLRRWKEAAVATPSNEARSCAGALETVGRSERSHPAGYGSGNLSGLPQPTPATRALTPLHSTDFDSFLGSRLRNGLNPVETQGKPSRLAVVLGVWII